MKSTSFAFRCHVTLSQGKGHLMGHKMVEVNSAYTQQVWTNLAEKFAHYAHC